MNRIKSSISESDIDFNEAFEEKTFCYHDYKLEDYFTLFVFWSLVLVVFLQFFTRYVMGNSTTWTEEIARYLLILLGFFGSVLAVRRGSHITVTFFYRYLPTALLPYLGQLVSLVSLGFYIFLAKLTFMLASRTRGKMVSIDWPKNLIYYAVCLAFILMVLHQAIHIFRNFKNSKEAPL